MTFILNNEDTKLAISCVSLGCGIFSATIFGDQFLFFHNLIVTQNFDHVILKEFPIWAERLRQSPGVRPKASRGETLHLLGGALLQECLQLGAQKGGPLLEAVWLLIQRCDCQAVFVDKEAAVKKVVGS